MKQYITYMTKCLELAKLAQGDTSPNPMVGCVVINENDEIISTGYHKKYGENHAERDALLKLDNAKNCTLVVNLEPCSHYGKTPPCADLIIEKGIKKVVYGMKDPNPIVAGRGLKKLTDAGIEVIGPVMENECKKLNEVFIINHTEKRIFTAIKTATTIDGKIATYNGDSKWITSSEARNEVKNIRKIYDAILTSSSTVIADNPTMFHKNKIILDRELKINSNAKIFEQGEIYIFHDGKIKSPQNIKNIHYMPAPVKNNKLDVKYILQALYDLGFRSVLVESGGILNGSFVDYADKIYHFIAPKILADNTGKSAFEGKSIEKIADTINFQIDDVKIFSPDLLVVYTKNEL